MFKTSSEMPVVRNLPRPKISILVVDDDPDFLELLSQQLEQIPCTEVQVAHDYQEAIALLSRRRFGLVVSDWALDSRTAPEVLRKADSLCPKTLRNQRVPVLFMSSSERVSQTQRLGALNNFEPVSFILKRLGTPLITLVAENILRRFYPMEDLQPCV